MRFGFIILWNTFTLKRESYSKNLYLNITNLAQTGSTFGKIFPYSQLTFNIYFDSIGPYIAKM